VEFQYDERKKEVAIFDLEIPIDKGTASQSGI